MAGVVHSKRFLLWALCAVLWFSSLGLREQIHPDEGRYAEISREMVVTKDFVTPRLNGLKYFEKPPLQYWITAAAFSAFGQSDFVARLWVGLCGFLSIVLVWITARRIWDTETADYSAIAAAGMFWLIALSHVVTLDMGVSFFLVTTLCGFILAHHDGATPRENRYWMWGAWAAIAGALLSKGLIGVAIPGAVLVLYSLITRQWVLWKRMQWIPGLLIFLVLGLPWHVLVAQRNPEWAQFYLIHEHFTRFLTTEHHRQGAWYYFVPILVGGLMPWTTLLPSIITEPWRAQSKAFHPQKLLLIWSGFVFLFFSASGSKLPGYILPMFPALALLLGPLLKSMQAQALRKHVIILIVFWAIIAAATPFLAYMNSAKTPAEFNAIFAKWLFAGAAIFVAGGLFALQQLKQSNKMLAMIAISLSSLLFMDVVAIGYQRSYTKISSGQDLAAALSGHITPDTRIFFVGIYDQSLPYYLQRTTTFVQYTDEFDLGEQQEPSKWIPTLAEFPAVWRAAPSAIAIVRPSLYTELQTLGLPMHLIQQDARRIVVEKPHD